MTLRDDTAAASPHDAPPVSALHLLSPVIVASHRRCAFCCASTCSALPRHASRPGISTWISGVTPGPMIVKRYESPGAGGRVACDGYPGNGFCGTNEWQK